MSDAGAGKKVESETELEFLELPQNLIKENNMHDGCGGSFESGQQVVDKVRTMGFAEQILPMPLEIKCEECGNDFSMETKVPVLGDLQALKIL